MNAEVVKRLWEKRMGVIHNLQAQAFVTENREPTAEERSADEAWAKELTELDEKIKKGLDELEREQRSSDAFDRYQKLTKGQNEPHPRQAGESEQAQGLRAFLKGETRSFDIEIDPRVQQHFNLEKRQWNPDVWERRDLLISESDAPMPTSFSGQLYEFLIASVGVLKAKTNTDNFLLTASGENMVLPRATAYGGAAWIGEGALITESDPTLTSITLSAYGDKALLDISPELVEDSGFDILGFVARTMGRNAGLLADAAYVNGDGSAKPTGFLAGLTVGATGPTGTSVSLGTQATAGQGSDLLVDLQFSVIEPYRDRGVWMMNDASVGKVARLKGSGGEIIWQSGLVPGSPDTLLGRPIVTDPNIPVMAANAKSIVFGDFSGYAVRIVRAVRFERSDHAKFENDLVSFKAVLRTDGKLIDTNAMKVFVNSAT